MKRYHQNLSPETMVFRTWKLLVDSLNESDFIWLESLGIPVSIDRPEHTFDTATGRKHTIYGKASYSVETTTEKQRAMLLLKYSDTAILIQEEILLPGTMSTCTLDRINW